MPKGTGYSVDQSILEQHRKTAGPDLPGFTNKNLGEVKGTRPHHDDKRNADNYNSKDLNPNDALSITKAR